MFFPRGPGENCKSRGNQLGVVYLTCRFSFLQFIKIFKQSAPDPAGPVRPVGIHGDAFQAFEQQSYKLGFFGGIHGSLRDSALARVDQADWK